MASRFSSTKNNNSRDHQSRYSGVASSFRKPIFNMAASTSPVFHLTNSPIFCLTNSLRSLSQILSLAMSTMDLHSTTTAFFSSCTITTTGLCDRFYPWTTSIKSIHNSLLVTGFRGFSSCFYKSSKSIHALRIRWN